MKSVHKNDYKNIETSILVRKNIIFFFQTWTNVNKVLTRINHNKRNWKISFAGGKYSHEIVCLIIEYIKVQVHTFVYSFLIFSMKYRERARVKIESPLTFTSLFSSFIHSFIPLWSHFVNIHSYTRNVCVWFVKFETYVYVYWNKKVHNFLFMKINKLKYYFQEFFPLFLNR